MLTAGSKVDISRIEFDQCDEFRDSRQQRDETRLGDEFPCVVHHGTTATGRAHMVANAATDSLTCKVRLILVFQL